MSDEAAARPLQAVCEPFAPLTVLFDAECPFCRWTVAHLRRWDRDGNLRIRPYQETNAQPVLADLLEGRALGRAIHVVDGAGRFATGGDAVLAVASLLPGGRTVAQLVAALRGAGLALGIGSGLGERLRPWVAAGGLAGPVIRERNPAFDPPDAPGPRRPLGRVS